MTIKISSRMGIYAIAAVTALCWLAPNVQAQSLSSVQGNSVMQGPQRAPRVSVGAGATYRFTRYSYGLPKSFQRPLSYNPLRYGGDKSLSSLLGAHPRRGSLPAMSANPPLSNRTTSLRLRHMLFSNARAPLPASPIQTSLRSYTGTVTPFPESRIIHSNRQNLEYQPKASTFLPIHNQTNAALLAGGTNTLPVSYRQTMSAIIGNNRKAVLNPILSVSAPNPIYRGMSGNELVTPYQLFSNQVSSQLALRGLGQSSFMPK